jgi:type I restriction enzyme R subunit
MRGAGAGFKAGRVVLDPEMGNPTLVVLTDRNDLDEQIFRTFARCAALLRQTCRTRRPRPCSSRPR